MLYINRENQNNYKYQKLIYKKPLFRGEENILKKSYTNIWCSQLF